MTVPLCPAGAGIGSSWGSGEWLLVWELERGGEAGVFLPASQVVQAVLVLNLLSVLLPSNFLTGLLKTVFWGFLFCLVMLCDSDVSTLCF